MNTTQLTECPSSQTERLPFSRGKIRVLAVAIAVFSSLIGSSLAQQVVPSFSKAFSPATIGPGSVSTLTFYIGNEESPTGIRGLRFVDKLPDGVVIANPANATNNCGGTLTAPAGGNVIELTEGSVPGNGSCTITVDVTSASIGVYRNVTEDLISDAGNSGSAVADLSVVEELPGFSKSFSPSRIGLGGRSTLTFTIDNSANEGGRSGVTFTDVLPAGMVVADPANATTDCSNGMITAVPGSSVISFAPEFFGAPGIGAFETCTVNVDVVATGVGILNNISGELTSTPLVGGGAVSSGKASATLEVVNDPILISKSFLTDPVAPGGTTRLRFTITNRSRSDFARNIRFDDDLEATLPGLVSISPARGGICGPESRIDGTSLVKFAGGELAPGASCSFEVEVRVPDDAKSGMYPNATSPILAEIAGSTEQGTPATDTLTVLPVPIFTKEFLNDPVTAGGTVTLEFTIVNSSFTSDAESIAFVDELPAELSSAASLPENDFCGSGSSIVFVPGSQFDPASLIMSGGTLKPQESCVFQVVFNIAESASTGVATNTTEPLTAVIDDQTVTAPPASDDLRIVSGPQLTKTFLDDPVVPGGVVTLRFTLTHGAEVPESATDIRFMDDLDAVIPGMVALGLPRADICGDGSIVRGTSVIDFRGGSLKPGETCSFDIPVQVPKEAPLGFATNTTSPVLSQIGGLEVVQSAPASDDLLVSTLTFSKRFLTDPVIPGGTTELEFTLTNDGPLVARNISFIDDLDGVLSGLVSETADQKDICGDGSTLSGTDVLIFQNGTLPPMSSCTFSVKVRVPVSTNEGDYINATGNLTAVINDSQISLPPATAPLRVSGRLLALEKSFSREQVKSGELVGLDFTITNLDQSNPASDITFTDVLPAGLTGAGGVQKDICGPGSQISGMGTLTFTGGRLAPGESCTFTVPVLVVEDRESGQVINITSEITGRIDGLPVSGAAASAELRIINSDDLFQISASKRRLDGSYLIEWFAVRGLTYWVDESIDLENWDMIPGSQLIGTGDFVQFINPPSGGPRRFYRLTVECE